MRIQRKKRWNKKVESLTVREEFVIRRSKEFISRAKYTGFVVIPPFICVKILLAWLKSERILYELYKLTDGNYRLAFNKQQQFNHIKRCSK